MAIKGLMKELEQFFLPQLNRIEGELKALDTRIDSVRNELKAEINSVRIEVKALAEKVDIIKEMEHLKHEVAELKARH